MPGGLAARVMGWQRRMGAVAGPLGASGEQSDGNPVQVELLINGVWTDITSYVLTRDGSEKISITRGRRDWGAQTEQSTCSFQLNNRDGRFSPRNPTSPYYGQLGRNQQLRISVPGPTGGKLYRFWGEISSWPSRWDTSGTDIWIDADAAGIMRRLNQGSAPLHSVIRQAITDPQLTGLVAYWPCEDATGATTIASALTNGSAMTFTGTPTLADYEGFGASDPLPVISSAVLSGGVARYDDPTATQVRFLIFIPQAGLTDGRVLCSIDQSDLTVGFWELYYTTTGNTLVLRQHDPDGAVLGAELTHTLDVRGRHMRISVELEESGSSVTRAVRITDLATLATESATDTAASTSLARVTRVQLGPASRSVVNPNTSTGLSGCAVGHVTVQNTITSASDLGAALNPAGETAGRRVERLCAEEAIAFDAVGDLDDTVAMGGQPRSKPIELMRECELADDGMLFENLAVFGLGYRTRASLLNQAPTLTLSYPGGQLSAAPEPVDDDQQLTNKVTVTSGGVSEMAELTDGDTSTADPPAGIGVYGSDFNLNLEDASALEDQASWRLHVGSVDETRYPQISVNLAHPTFTGDPALKAQALAVRPGDRLVVADPPSWLPPDDINQLVLGVSETIDHFQHRITYTCSPYSPWSTGIIEDSVYARLDTDGSALYADATSAATTVYVTRTGTGGLWTQDDTNVPFDVRAGGEVMTVTDITYRGTDDFNRSETNQWGTSSGGDAWTLVSGSATDRSVNGTRGVVTLASAPSTIRFQHMLSDITDCEILVKISVDQVATGAAFLPAILFRYQDTSNFYRCRLHFETTGGLFIATTRGTTQIESTALTYTYTAGDEFYLRSRVTGDVIYGKAWPTSEAEPLSWQVDTAITVGRVDSGAVGLAASAFGTNTNVNPQLRYDDFQILDPQKFTVTRSVNGVTKAQTAGTDVRLAYPTILSM